MVSGEPRRGMAFTDAWYYGNATLDGATAVFCATVKSIPSLLERPRVIAATTWSLSGTAPALPAGETRLVQLAKANEKARKTRLSDVDFSRYRP